MGCRFDVIWIDPEHKLNRRDKKGQVSHISLGLEDSDLKICSTCST